MVAEHTKEGYIHVVAVVNVLKNGLELDLSAFVNGVHWVPAFDVKTTEVEIVPSVQEIPWLT
jgi:hypothetical protein